MSLHRSPTSTVERSSAGNWSETQLRGTWLVLARIGWMVFTLLAIGLFFASLPPYFAYLHIVNSTFPGGPQLSPSDVQALHKFGLSLDFYAWFQIGINLITLMIYLFVGIVLFWYKSNDRVALLASTTLIAFPLFQSTPILG